MPTKFSEAPSEVVDLMHEVIDEYFGELKLIEPELTIDVQMAENWKTLRPLMRHGHAAMAMIKVVKGEERAEGACDLRLQIDAMRWEKLDDKERKALLHHELSHVEPKYHKDGKLKLDEYRRPQVKLKPDDWMLTGFEETARIFGAKSLERQAVNRVADLLRQMELPFEAAAETAQAEAEKPKRAKKSKTTQARA